MIMDGSDGWGMGASRCELNVVRTWASEDGVNST
jgi:hypothetical protein